MADGRDLSKDQGQWRYFYRSVDKQGNTIYFLLTAKRDKKSALRVFTKAIGRNGKPGLINIDKAVPIKPVSIVLMQRTNDELEFDPVNI